MNSNPLAKHFRQPSIYLKLPSQGKFWGENALDLPDSGEIPVYPMTTKDEITIRTPDALLNGQGVVDVIADCCPNIKDPWGMPSADVDAILIAIRIASYGHLMQIDSVCPKCKNENEYDIDLHTILDGIRVGDFTKPVTHNKLTFTLKPQLYKQLNKLNLVTFEEQQALKTINDNTLDDELKKEKFKKHLDALININLQAISNSIQSITTEDGVVVTDHTFIKEFISNSSTVTTKFIQDRLGEISKEMEMKPARVQCSNCEHQYEITINFDYSSFFDRG